MKLKKFRVREFRSIWDSGWIEIDDKHTCLVGKNESGKTALLTALYKTNPIIRKDAVFDETYDYPKREIAAYRYSVENKERTEAVVALSLYELEERDINRVASKFGKKVLKSAEFSRETYYGDKRSAFILQADEEKARYHLARNSNIPVELTQALEQCENWQQFGEELDQAEQTEPVTKLKELVDKVRANGLEHYIFNSLIWPFSPKFLYFDEYYQMQGCENLNALIERENNDDLKESDHPLLGLINLARLDHRELVSTNNTVELKNKLEGASNHLTGRIIRYWSQNQHIQMRFDVRDAKPEDPEGMRDGINIWGEIHDTVHWASTALGSRSRGFVWFFSFLAWYEDIKRQNQNVILLLDEPGLSLHGRAQGDLLRYFDEELTRHQVIYTTHSPFMIDLDRYDRIRIVQDLGIDTSKQLPREKDGTKVITDVFEATEDSLFPLQGALGYDIHQTLFVGPNSLIVEGAADLLFLKTMSSELEREGRTGLSDRWVVTPVGGSGKVPTFVALLSGQKNLNLATLLDIQKQDKQKIEDLYKKRLLKKKNVLTYADFLDQDYADIEDIFDRDFYVEIVNREYASQLQSSISLQDLNRNEPRTLKSIEEYLNRNPLSSGNFNHFRPARYFTENYAELQIEISESTKERFEAIFERLNSLLK